MSDQLFFILPDKFLQSQGDQITYVPTEILLRVKGMLLLIITPGSRRPLLSLRQMVYVGTLATAGFSPRWAWRNEGRRVYKGLRAGGQ